MSTNKLSLNIFQSCLEDQDFKIKFYYDRVKLYVDSANKQAELNKVRTDEKQHKIIPRALLHYTTMNQMIDARQPDDAYFKRLNTALIGDYLINYVEFAMDIIGKNKRQVTKLRSLLNELLTFERKSTAGGSYFYHGHSGNTHYFGNRHNHKDILAIYSDKESKVAPGKSCVHIEMRLYGSGLLKDFCIYTLQDLIDYQHDSFWENYLDLRDVNYTGLGRLVSQEKPNLTESSLRRRGQNTFNDYGGSQALLMDKPSFASAFMPIKNRRMFESRLENALR